MTYTHTFEVKNTRQDSVSIQMSEQVPLSTDDRIKVSPAFPGFGSTLHSDRSSSVVSTAVSMTRMSVIVTLCDNIVQVHIAEPELRKQGVPCPLPSGHAVLNEDNNAEWHVSVAAGAELSLRLVYSVEYPLQDDVEGLPKS